VRAGGKIKGSEEMKKFIKKIELHPINGIDNEFHWMRAL
jgi:hypothetical protein